MQNYRIISLLQYLTVTAREKELVTVTNYLAKNDPINISRDNYRNSRVNYLVGPRLGNIDWDIFNQEVDYRNQLIFPCSWYFICIKSFIGVN